MSSIFSPALEVSALDSSEQDSVPLASVRPTSSARTSYEGAGQASQSTRISVMTAGFPCQDLSVAGKRVGLSGSRSSLMYALIGLLSRTSSILGAGGCPNCEAPSTESGMPACHFKCPPATLEAATKGAESSLLPTPTASSYGSCRGGGAGRVGKWRKSLQSLGILNPGDWERMMGFPVGWTDAECWEMQSVRRPSSSLVEPLPAFNSIPSETGDLK